MKQGTGKSSIAGGKVEPRPKAINPSKVAGIGLQEVRMRPHRDLGRGYKAPMNKSSTHKGGTQGKH